MVVSAGVEPEALGVGEVPGGLDDLGEEGAAESFAKVVFFETEVDDFEVAVCLLFEFGVTGFVVVEEGEVGDDFEAVGPVLPLLGSPRQPVGPLPGSAHFLIEALVGFSVSAQGLEAEIGLRL